MTPAHTVKTRTVAGQRVLHFESLADLGAQVEQMAVWKSEARALGNWSPGQNLAHLALVMNFSIDGFPTQLPWIARFLLRLLFKRRILTRPMRPGFKAPIDGGVVPPKEVSFEDGLERMRAALRRLQVEPQRAPSPIVGRLDIKEWDQLHCRHAELHLSFVVPV